MQISLKGQSVLGWLTKNSNKHNNNKKSYSLYNVVSVREEFWVSQWLVSQAKNVIRGAYKLITIYRTIATTKYTNVGVFGSIPLVSIS